MSQHKVLIVDDSSIIRQVIEKYLKNYQIEIVGKASNGREALTLFKEKNPTIVTLDITMPEMDGLTVLEEMKKENPQIKVVVITALSDKATGIKALELGAKNFVAKPFTEARIRETFETLIK